MNNDQKREIRRKSMLGTVLFVLGVSAGVAAVVTGWAWMAGVAVVLLVPAVLMLHRVGRTLS